MPSLELKNIFKSYGQTKVVHNLDLDINDKEFVVLVGPSGCGKSTTLRMIAGLEEITSGDLMINEQKMNNVSPVNRGVAMVFQDYALYPHMTVFENMAFGLRLKNVPKEEIKQRVEQTAEMLDLTKYLHRKPAALSGGQRQRVAMGRAVVKRAEIFLFDEPLSNLDAKLRSKMRLEIKQFHKKFNTTSVYVTHDQLEAMTLADRLVVMKNGFIEQAGTPMEVYDKPKNVFVATFIGSPSMNILPFAVNWDGDKCTLTADMEGFNVEVPAERAKCLKGIEKIELGIRPTDVILQKEGTCVEATVEMVELLGKNAYLTIKAGLYDITVDVEGHDCPEEGDKVYFKFDYSKAHFFDFKTKVNLEF